MSHNFPTMALRCCNARTLINVASSHITDYVAQVLGQSRCLSTSKWHLWFKRLGDFAEQVDFSSGKRLRAACKAGLFSKCLVNVSKCTPNFQSSFNKYELLLYLLLMANQCSEGLWFCQNVDLLGFSFILVISGFSSEQSASNPRLGSRCSLAQDFELTNSKDIILVSDNPGDAVKTRL